MAISSGIVLTSSGSAGTNVSNAVGVLSISNGGTGLNTIGGPNQVLGVNAAGTAMEYKTLTAGPNITITYPSPGVVTITSTGGGGGSYQLYAENPVSPTPPSATGTNSIALLSASSATATNSLAIGVQAVSRIQGGIVQANGRFAASGDAQSGRYLIRNITTGALPVQLFVDGVGGSIVPTLVDNSTWTFRILVTAHRTDALGGQAGYSFEGVIYRTAGASSVALQGVPGKTVIAESNPPWDANVTADTANGGINVTVSGESSKTIRWLAVVDTVEITN